MEASWRSNELRIDKFSEEGVVEKAVVFSNEKQRF